jgi:hypothetical protein
MPRKRKQKIKVNNTESLEGLMQEVYNDACVQINDAQRNINELINTIAPEDIDDITKIAKEKTSAHKIKESGIKIKLEVAKLQSDIIKHNGNLDETSSSRSADGIPTLEDYKELREFLKDEDNNK